MLMVGVVVLFIRFPFYFLLCSLECCCCFVFVFHIRQQTNEKQTDKQKQQIKQETQNKARQTQSYMTPCPRSSINQLEAFKFGTSIAVILCNILSCRTLWFKELSSLLSRKSIKVIFSHSLFMYKSVVLEEINVEEMLVCACNVSI